MLAHQPSATDHLFITLRKSEALFSPSTRYCDLALGPSLFHWESQSTTGQRTIHHAERGSPTEPFVCLGFASYESHERERILFFHQWRFAGGWSGRSRQRGYQAVAWHKSGVGDLRGVAGCSDQLFAFSIRMRTSLAERISMLR